MNDKPNIIEFIMHDLGTHLNCYGETGADTPHIDALARESVVFDRMFCTAPQCSPARASIMTGCYPHTVGMLGLAHLGWGYKDGQRTITQILKEEGYRTYLGGIHHECAPGPAGFVREKLGYHEYSRTAPVELLDRATSQPEPFFFSMGFFAAHRPFASDVSDREVKAAVPPPYVPDTPETRKDCAQLNALVAETDRTIGAALEVLSTSGAGENTIVLFTTDHGPELNRAKMTLYDPGIRVTCMLRVPGSQGRRVGALASTIDILPTLLDLCGIQTPEFVQGRSLAAVCGIESSQQAVRQLPAVGAAMGRRYIVAEKTYHVIYDPSRCIRTNRFKYVMNRLPHQPIQLSVQHSYRIGLDRCGELYGTPRGEEELYDLETDPGERENLAYDPAYSETRAKLREKLLTVLRETGDPLLDGPIPHRVRVRPQMEWIFDPSVGHFVPQLTDAAPKRLMS